jgi:hypothetical protein
MKKFWWLEATSAPTRVLSITILPTHGGLCQIPMPNKVMIKIIKMLVNKKI